MIDLVAYDHSMLVISSCFQSTTTPSTTLAPHAKVQVSELWAKTDHGGSAAEWGVGVGGFPPRCAEVQQRVTTVKHVCN